MASITTAALPTGKPFTGTVARLSVAAHVNAYIARLTTAQTSAFYALSGAAQARAAGCANYRAQYQWRQHLRSTGVRVKGTGGAGNWGQNHGKTARGANAAANKKAGIKGKATAKRQAQAADATAQAADATAQG